MIGWILLALALLGTPASAAEPAYTQLLDGPWKLQFGDDPAWAAPGWDDAAWPVTGVPGAWEAVAPGRDGFAWYRRSVVVPERWAAGPVGVRLGSVGDAYELYWDGVRLGGGGAFPPHFVESVAPSLFLVPNELLAAHPGRRHVLAVRVYNAYAFGGLLGGVRVGRYDVLATEPRPGGMVLGGMLAFFLAIGAYHLAFFLRRRAARENLLFAALCGLAALYGATFAPVFVSATIHWVNPFRLGLVVLLLAGPVYLGLLTRLFELGFTRAARVAALLCFLAAAAAVLLPLPDLALLHGGVSIAISGGLLASLLWAERASRRTTPARLLTTGLAALSISMIWDLLSDQGFIPVARLIPGVPGLFWVGFITFVVAVGLETATRFARAENDARVDPLTGLMRRHVFEEALAREADRHRRSAGTLTLLVMDLDYFKSVNDTYGHRVGDVVLERVGHLLRHSARNIDLTARLGGEEFAVLLSDTDLAGASAFAQRFCQRLGLLEVETQDGVVRGLTVSVGVAVTSGWVGTDRLLDAADQAMYEAKRTGRNRVSTVSLPEDRRWPAAAIA